MATNRLQTLLYFTHTAKLGLLIAMPFTAASIVAPNVPDKLDPLTYLTRKPPSSKVQELAQEQASALGRAVMRGLSATDIEQLVLRSAAAPKSNLPELTEEEIAEFQEAKTCQIRTKLDKPPPASLSVDYPYLFVNGRSRLAFNYMDAVVRAIGDQPNDLGDKISSEKASIKDPVPDPPNAGGMSSENPSGTQSKAVSEASTEDLDQSDKAPGAERSSEDVPIIELEAEEFAGFSAETLDKYDFEIARFRTRGAVSVRIPLNADFTGLKTTSQVLLRHGTELDYRSVKRGFFRALIRFHTSREKKLQKLPTFERRAIDFFRMFHIVERKGGPAEVVKHKEWAQVGRELGYSSSILPTLSTTMRGAYTKVLSAFGDWIRPHLVPGVLPQLEVTDDKVPQGWTHLGDGIIVYTEAKAAGPDREVVALNLQKTACVTLRSYKTEHSDTLPVSQQKFDELPEFFESDFISPVKLFGFPSYVEYRSPFANAELGDISDLPFRNTIFGEVAEVPELHAGRRYSVDDVGAQGRYHASMIVDGVGFTCRTEDGRIFEQLPGELVVSKTKLRRWRHGYNASVECELLPRRWLQECDPRDGKAQRLVYEMCVSTEEISEDLLAYVLAALNKMRQLETSYVQKLGPPITEDAGDSDACFSCIKFEGKTFPSETGHEGEFCAMYTDVDEFFNNLEARIQSRPRAAQSWRDKVHATLAQQPEFPTPQEIAALLVGKGDTVALYRLQQVLQSLQRWRQLPEPQKVENLRRLVFVSDAEVKEYIPAREDGKGPRQPSFREAVDRALQSANVAESLLEIPVQGNAQERDFLAVLHKACVWVMTTIKLIRPPVSLTPSQLAIPTASIPNEAAAFELRSAGFALGFPSGCELMIALDSFIMLLSQANVRFTAILNSVEALDIDVVMLARTEYLSVLPYLNTELQEELGKIAASEPLFMRMKDPDVTKRPRRAELGQMPQIKAMIFALAELDSWLLAAKALPWTSIYTQIQAMTTGAPLTAQPAPISRAEIFRVYFQMFNLKIVPDDVVQVFTTFQNTVAHLNQPLAMNYGFTA